MIRTGIDISNTYHKSYAIVSNYEGFDINEEKWQLTLGRKFVTDLLSIIKKFPDSQVMFAFDSTDNFRKVISKEYKANRTRKEQAFYDLLDEIYEILKGKGYNTVKINGLEADDILALYHENAYLDDFTVLVSNDEDIRQLVDENTVVFTANTSNYKLYCDSIKTVAKNAPNFISEAHVVNPLIIFFKKLLLGCDGDNVKRILPKGQGPAKVEKICDYITKNDAQLDDALSHFGYDITNEELMKQTKLVCLGSSFMPTEYSYKYLEQTLNNIPVETDMKILLTGTRFIS